MSKKIQITKMMKEKYGQTILVIKQMNIVHRVWKI